jgi:enterochelin esterase family protein
VDLRPVGNQRRARDRGDVNFLLGEIVSQGTDRYSITEDPDRWGIGGGSSGGNSAFTAAWLRPDKFRRVIGCLSSFAQMPDGSPYPL